MGNDSKQSYCDLKLLMAMGFPAIYNNELKSSRFFRGGHLYETYLNDLKDTQCIVISNKAEMSQNCE